MKLALNCDSYMLFWMYIVYILLLSHTVYDCVVVCAKCFVRIFEI